MSGNRLEAYKDLLVAAAGKTGDVRDGIQRVVNTFTASAESRGEPWGNDSLGRQFSQGDQGYLASKKNMVEGATNMAGTFGNFSKSQQDSADKLDQMDHGNADGFK